MPIAHLVTDFITDSMAAHHSPQVELASNPQHLSSTALTDLELLQDSAINPSEHTEGFFLPPTDGGKDAWLCLFACFMLEALIWGTFHISLRCTQLILNRLSLLLWCVSRILQC